MMKENWKPVTIGGFTGILMGAASTLGVQKAMSHETTAEDVQQPSVDYDSLSFKDAFDAARAQMGPGGVFTWHGNVYNTYTAAEWNAKTHLEKVQFAEHVKQDETIATIEETQEPDEDVTIVETDIKDDKDEPLPNANENLTSTQEVSRDVASLETEQHDLTWDEVMSTNSDDVHIIGFREVEYGRGRSLAMQDLDVNGQRVAVIDVDKDGTPDYAMSDLNHNHKMDDGEVIDLHTGEELSFTNDTPVDNVPDFEGFPA